jgi:acetyl-CoA acetyltransferase
MAREILERRAAITGVGMSAAGRNLGKTAIELTIDAILAAVEHAGISIDEIDGLCTMPGMSESPGMAPVPLREIKNALGLRLNWFSSIQEGPAQMSAIMNPVMWVAAGQARHVLSYRTSTQYSAISKNVAEPRPEGAPAKRWNGWQSWAFPFNALSPIYVNAIITRVRMDRYGLTREQLGAWAVNCRANAQHNPAAIYRTPLTLDDYLSSRMISDPLCLFDCDAPIDSSVAVIVSSMDAARDLRHPPLRVEAMSGALYGKDSWDQFDDLAAMASRDTAKHLWERTDLKPTDIQLANVYDGFSIQALAWIEALGFCGEGESGAFIEGGRRIALNGETPMNTGGGQLSGGRQQGFGLLAETCLQLWGEAGERQVAGNPEVGLTATGGNSMAGCLILTRQ